MLDMALVYPLKAGAFSRFCDDVDNFPPGILRWDVEKRSKEIDFLDLTISINEKNHIMNKTYRKPQNIANRRISTSIFLRDLHTPQGLAVQSYLVA